MRHLAQIAIRHPAGRISLAVLLVTGISLGVLLAILSFFDYGVDIEQALLTVRPAYAGNGDVILLWEGATIPTGWTCISCSAGDALYPLFPRAAGSYGQDTGQNWHQHTLTWGTSSVSNSQVGKSDAAGFGGTGTFPNHTHSGGSGQQTGTSDQKPPYKNLKAIYANNPATLPNGIIGIFDVASTSSLPANWSYYSPLDGRYLRTDGSTSTGGSAEHTAAMPSDSILPTTSLTGVKVNTNGASFDTPDFFSNHTHDLAGKTINAASNTPPFVTVVFAQLQATSSPPDGLIALFNAGQLPSNWSAISGSESAYYQRLLKGGNSFGATGGSATHVHQTSTVESWGASSSINVAGGGNGAVFAPMSHTHTVTATTDSQTSWPYYRDVILGKYSAPGGGTENLKQVHYRWRSDNGTEANATFPGAEDTPTSSVAKYDTKRLRIEVSNGSGTATSSAYQYRLEYATSTSPPSWTAVGSGGHWVMKDSTNITNGASTTNVASGLTDVGSPFTAGQILDTGNPTGQITIGNGGFTELEFSIAATSTALDSTTYYFRVSKTGTALDAYPVYASATTAAAGGGGGEPLPSLRPDEADGTSTQASNQTGLCSQFTCLYSIDDDPDDSPITADYVYGIAGQAAYYFVNITDTPANFLSMDTLQVDADIALFNFDDDTAIVYAQVFKADETTTLTDEVQVATQAQSGLRSLTFSTVSSSDKTTWDGARLRLRWTYTQNMASDFAQLRVTAVELDGTYTVDEGGGSPDLRQVHYRWRNDDGTEASASWAADEDTSITGVTRYSVRRLRLEVSNSNGTATSTPQQFRLEYATDTANAFVQVGASGSTTEHWVLIESQLVNTNPTTNVANGLTDVGSPFVAGQQREMYSAQTDNITMPNGGFTELEYSIAATSTALDSTTYYFRVSNAGTALDSYPVYASATIAGAAPNMRQIHWRWRSNDGGL